jgi:hypothetical protein
MKSSLIATLGAVVGILAGVVACYSTMKGEARKMRSDMEAEIRDRVMVETRLSRLETQQKALKDSLWTLEQRVNGAQ